MVAEMVANAAPEPLTARDAQHIEDQEKKVIDKVYKLVSKQQILNEGKYKKGMPLRVDNFIEWMHTQAADERPTIQQCLSNFWMRCEPEDRMTPQQLANLESYLKNNKPKGSRKEVRKEIRKAESNIIACIEEHKSQMRDYDIAEVDDTMAALPKISLLAFARMVFSMRDSHGETVEAIWNGYPRECSKWEEHPFAVENCFWCGHSRKNYLLKLGVKKEEEERRLKRERAAEEQQRRQEWQWQWSNEVKQPLTDNTIIVETVVVPRMQLGQDAREETKWQRQQKWKGLKRCEQIDTEKKTGLDGRKETLRGERERKKGNCGGRLLWSKEAAKEMTRRRREKAEKQGAWM